MRVCTSSRPAEGNVFDATAVHFLLRFVSASGTRKLQFLLLTHFLTYFGTLLRFLDITFTPSVTTYFTVWTLITYTTDSHDRYLLSDPPRLLPATVQSAGYWTVLQGLHPQLHSSILRLRPTLQSRIHPDFYL